MLNNNQYQKTFYDLYLCQYIVFTDVYKKHKLAYRNQKHKSICNKYSIQLYTRKLTKNLFQLCCSYINKEFDFEYCNKYKKVNISNTKTKKQIYWVEHYNEKNYSYNVTNIKIYNFDEINENIEKNKKENNKQKMIEDVLIKKNIDKKIENIYGKNHNAIINSQSNLEILTNLNKDVLYKTEENIHIESLMFIINKLLIKGLYYLSKIKKMNIKIKNDFFNWFCNTNHMFIDKIYLKFVKNLEEDQIKQKGGKKNTIGTLLS